MKTETLTEDKIIFVAKHSEGIYKSTIYEETNPGTDNLSVRNMANQVAKEDAEKIVLALNNYDSLLAEIESWKKENFDNVETASETIKELKAINDSLLSALKVAKNKFKELMDNPSWAISPFGSVWNAFQLADEAIKAAEQ